MSCMREDEGWGLSTDMKTQGQIMMRSSARFQLKN